MPFRQKLIAQCPFTRGDLKFLQPNDLSEKKQKKCSPSSSKRKVDILPEKYTINASCYINIVLPKTARTQSGLRLLLHYDSASAQTETKL